MSLGAEKRLAVTGLSALFIKGLGAVISYAMVVSFAHFLDAAEFGRFASGMNAAIIISTVVGVGFATGIMRYWPLHVVAGENAWARRIAQFGYVITALASVVILAIAALLGSVPAVTANVGSSDFLITVAFLAAIIAFGDYSTNLLRAQGSTLVSMLPREILWRVTSPAVAFLVWRFGAGLSGTTSLAIAAVVLVLLTLWQAIHIRRNINALAPDNKGQQDFKTLLPSLAPLWVAGIIFAMIQQFDVVIVGSLLSKVEAGSYFAAQKTAQLLSLVLIAGGLATAPHMSALYHAGRLVELQALCRKLAIAIAAITFAGFFFLVIAGKLLLSIFDPQFVSAYPILIALALGTVVDAVAGPTAYLMQMTKFEGAYLKILIGCYGLVIAAQFFLIPRYGSFGAALASASGVILWNVMAIVVLRRHAGLDTSLLSVILPPRPKDRS